MQYKGVAQDKAIMIALDIIRNPFVWPGCYEKVAVMYDGEMLCKDCIKNNLALISRAEERDEWHIAGVDIVENLSSDMVCAHCGRPMQED